LKTPIYKKYGFWLAVIAILLVAAIGIELYIELSDNRVSQELSISECQQIVDTTFSKLPVSNTGAAKYILDNSKITVQSVEYGYEKDIILTCGYETIDAKSALLNELDGFMLKAYEYSLSKTKASGSDIDLRCVRKPMLETLANAQPISGTVQLHIYETEKGMTLYLSDEVVDTCTGGIITLKKKIQGIYTVEHQGETVDITKNGSLRTGVSSPLALSNYSSAKPFTGGKLIEAWRDFKADFHKNFIEATGICTSSEVLALHCC